MTHRDSHGESAQDMVADAVAVDRPEPAMPEIETFPTTDAVVRQTEADGAVRVSIGILAYNEETSIADTIESVLNQSIVKEPPEGWEVEIVCVPNGCTDRTAEAATRALGRLGGGRDSRSVAGRVEVVERPSKHNAWNEFVHRLSRTDATHLVLMDGDVRLLGERTLESMLRRLLGAPDAYVCGARTVKDIDIPGFRVWSLRHRISSMASAIRRNDTDQRGEAGFAGCLYACPAEACRRFVLPEVLVGEDSFLRAVWSTNFFTNAVGVSDPRRVVSAEDATVLFEAYTGTASVLKNLRRRMVGLTINSMLYDRLWAESSTGADAGVLLTRWAGEDPGWDRRLIAERIAARGSWVVLGGSFASWATSQQGLWKWFHRMRGMPLSKRVCRLPGACVGTMLHAYACISANRLVRTGRTEGLWFTTKTRLGASGVRATQQTTVDRPRTDASSSLVGERS